MVNRYFDDFITKTHGETVSQHVIPKDGDVRKDIIKLKFNGDDKPLVTDTTRFVSDIVDIRRYKSIDIFVRNKAQAWNIEVGISAQLDSESGLGLIQFYDWENEVWVHQFIGDGQTGSGAVLIPFHNNTFISLSSHPNFYWLKKTEIPFIRLSFTATQVREYPTQDDTVEAWLVGEKNV